KFGGPVVIGDTTGLNTNKTQVYVYGTGIGHLTDPYNGTGQQVVQFNALRQNNRSALTLANGVVYVAFAGLGLNIGPAHGWVIAHNANTLALQGVLNTTPNGQYGDIWESGGKIEVDSAGSLFFNTGNGTFDGNNGASGNTPPAPGPVTGLDANGF